MGTCFRRCETTGLEPSLVKQLQMAATLRLEQVPDSLLSLLGGPWKYGAWRSFKSHLSCGTNPMLNKLNIKIRTIPSRSSSSITINFVGETTNTSFFDFDFLSNFKSVSLSYPRTSQCCHRFFFVVPWCFHRRAVVTFWFWSHFDSSGVAAVRLPELCRREPWGGAFRKGWNVGKSCHVSDVIVWFWLVIAVLPFWQEPTILWRTKTVRALECHQDP